ncbi:MAG: hypothetical protein KDA77_22760, partial [Planctomycetaceae bacterium]|nr:hypothetical protein [Planctomycetaceae bacterium]
IPRVKFPRLVKIALCCIPLFFVCVLYAAIIHMRGKQLVVYFVAVFLVVTFEFFETIAGRFSLRAGQRANSPYGGEGNQKENGSDSKD